MTSSPPEPVPASLPPDSGGRIPAGQILFAIGFIFLLGVFVGFLLGKAA